MKLRTVLSTMVSLSVLPLQSFGADPATGNATFNIRAVVSGNVGIMSASGGQIQDMEMVYVPGVGLEDSTQLIQFTSNDAADGHKISVTLPVAAKISNAASGTDVPLTVSIADTQLSTTTTEMSKVTIDPTTHKSAPLELKIHATGKTDSLGAGTYNGSVVLNISQPTS